MPSVISGDANVSATEFGYLDGVTSAIQTQLAARPTGTTGAWTAYTPTVSAETGTFTSASATGRYAQIGKLVVVNFTVIVTTAGTASGQIRITAPVSKQSVSDDGSGSCRENQATGNLCSVFWVDATRVAILRYDNVSMIASGRTFVGTIIYEAA